MKYIVTRQKNGVEEIFQFPATVNHDCMAEAVMHMRDQTHAGWTRVQRDVISAGFVQFGKCVGMSESLRLGSRPQDSDLLK